MLGILSLSLAVDKPSYLVGESPTYTLQNAVPGSIVKWTSFKNEQPTGEYEEVYEGGVIGTYGGAELMGGAWTDDQVGNWQKIATVIAPDGSRQTAQVKFTVNKLATTATPVVQQPTNWFAGTFDIPLGQQTISINRGLGLGILVFGVWGLSSLGKRR